jgi:osmotically-inducible protein OsmY
MAGATIAQTDQDVQRDVQLELNWDARVSPNENGVAVKDGVVTLSETVDNYTRKWSAERAALRVRGVRAVVNEIQVRLEGDDHAVRSWAERREAERVAWSSPGVTAVENPIVIQA